MTEIHGEVFIVEEERLRFLNARPLRIRSVEGEAALQKLIEDHPEVLPGQQMAPNDEDPLHFVTLCHEMPVGVWSTDILLVDQNGILTLVETKLAENTEARREVIGQILEYAANAAVYWGNGRARSKAAEFWAKSGRNIDEVINTEFGRDDVEDFWRQVDENLQHHQIRLIIAADELRPEVRRIIEYLNGEMSNATIYGLELRYYEDESTRVIVPRLVGQTQAVADRKEAARAGTLWTADRLRDEYDNLEDTALGKRLRSLLDWATNESFFVQGTSKNPGFGLRGRSGQRIVSFFPDHAFCYLKDEKYPGGAQERDRFVEELKAIGMYDQSFDPRPRDTKNLARKLMDLSDDEFQTLLDIFSRFCAKAESTS